MGLDLILYRKKQYQENQKTNGWTNDSELAYGRKTWSLVYAFKWIDGVTEVDNNEMNVPFEALKIFLKTYKPLFYEVEDLVNTYTSLDYVLNYSNEDVSELAEDEYQALEKAWIVLNSILERKLDFIDYQLGLAWELRAWMNWLEAIDKEIQDPEHDDEYILIVSY